MGKAKPVVIGKGLAQKRNPFALCAVLLAALMLSGENTAVADKGGLGPHPAAIPNVNLGLSAIPNMRTPVGLPAGAMVASPGATPFEGSGPGQSAGNGTSAQMAAPGAARSNSASGLTPPGHNRSNGEHAAGLQRSSHRNDVQDSGNPGLGLGQGKSEELDGGTLTAAPSDPARSLPERLAAAQSQSSNSSGKNPDQLPTCR